MLDERSVQTASTPFNIFKNKENVKSMFNESLSQFKIDSIHFQQAFNIFYAFNNVGRPVLKLINNSCSQKPINDLHFGQVDES